MSSTGENSHVDVVRLTKAAAEAAEFGRWDAVVQYYRERGDLLGTIQMPVREAGDLVKLDEQIRDRARTVQAVLASLLSEATATRRRFQDLRQRLGGRPSAPVTVSKKA